MKTITKITLFLLAAFFIAAVTAEAAELTVHVPAQVEIQGDKVHFGDLAQIDGPDCALKNDLADVYITQAPDPGKRVNIRQAYLAHRLRQSGLPLELIEWHVPEMSTVTRAFQTLDQEWVKAVVTEYLTGTEPYQSGDWELISVRTGELPNLPVGEVQYTTSVNSSTNLTLVSLNIYVNVDGAEAGRIRATCKVDLKIKALVANRRMERGYVIGPEDVSVERISVDKVREGALLEPGNAIGLVCKTRIRKGSPVLGRYLERKTLVRRGDMVTIVAQSGPLRVSSLGQAKQDGALGETVAVTNTGSKKTILATVVNTNTVEVTF